PHGVASLTLAPSPPESGRTARRVTPRRSPRAVTGRSATTSPRPPGAASGRTPSRPLCGPCREVPMRYFRIRALLPALALVLALATAVRADCSHELGLEWTSDTAVLIGTEERLQEAYLPISLWPA